MKIIIRLDTDDMEQIKAFEKRLESDIWVIPYGDMIKISTIKDNGDIVNLK